MTLRANALSAQPTTRSPPVASPVGKAAQILEAAKTIFLKEGFEAASMDTIAKTANVSKATLYAHYRSKVDLFGAVITDECTRRVALFAGDDIKAGDIRWALRLIGGRLIDLLLSPEAIAINRIVIAESQRFPEIGATFWNAGPERVIAQLTALFDEANRAGTLVVPDTRLAAEQFVTLIKVETHSRRLLNLPCDMRQERLATIVEGAVRLLLKGYAA